MGNLALLVFTILTQASVGIFLVHSMWQIKRTGSRSIDRVEYRTLIIAFLSGVSGLFSSFLHLNYPLNSIYSLTNIGSSWMSREILSISLYLLSLFVLLLAKWGKLKGSLVILFRNLALLSGIAVVYSMIKVYSIPGLTGLNSSIVSFSFVCTAFFTGSALLSMANRRTYNLASNLLFFSGICLTISFLNYLIYIGKAPHNQTLSLVCTITYVLSFLSLIPALIPRYKNIFMLSAVMFITLGLISETINRLLLLSLTSYNI